MSVAWRRRWPLILLATLVGAVALFALLGYLVAPGIVRDQIEKRLGEALARPVRVERVEIRPFALAATVHRLEVDQPDGKPLLTIDAIEADASIASLWHRAPVVDTLRILRPHLSIARVAPARYDISDLLDRWLAPSSEPTPKFSLNNIQLLDGKLDFDDRPARRVHHVEKLEVGLPFLSSLPYEVEIDVQPRLSGVAEGTTFALTGHAKPLAPRRDAELDVDVDGLALREYVGYLPATLRARLADGKLTTRLKVAFTQPPGETPRITVSGTAVVAALAITRGDAAPLAAAREVRLALEKLDPQARTLRIASLAIDQPSLVVRRLADGRLELAGPWMDAAAPGTPAAAEGPPWRVELVEASVKDGRARVEDASVQPRYEAEVTALQASARALATTAERSGRVTASMRIDDEANATLEAEVAIAPFAMGGRFTVANARLARLYPYAAQALDLAVQRGSADYASAFDVAASGEVRLTGGTASVRDLALALPREREPLVRLPGVAIAGLDVDVPARRVAIAELVATQPQAVLVRGADGQWNAARLMRTTAATGTDTAPVADATWRLDVARAVVERGDVRVTDATMMPPITVRLDEIALKATDVGNARDRRSALDLQARVERSGRIALKGPLTSNPFSANLDVQADRLPLLVAKPWVEREVNLVLAGGLAAARGRVDLVPGAGGAMTAAWNGDVTLSDVEALDPPTGGRLFAWRALALQKVKARSVPVEASVGSVALSDFYARLIVYADGSINLAKLSRSGAGAASAPAAAVDATAARPQPAGRARGSRPAEPGAMAAAAQAAEKTLRRAVDGALPLAIGRITLAGGNVNFSDYFIRPNYSANLTQVAGTVSALSASQAGEVAITAKVDDAAPVTISGRIQPFARELSLALAGRARDIELAPLSPYSAKYAGYGITKGKLSFDVDYTVENRKLDARNRLVLDQLTFGERVESPEATKLPVLLAVALLKDANGVIDLELPISGTLDDPQFSVFGLIVRVIVNLIGKAATAPFAILGAIVGSGEELSFVEFAAGSTTLDPEGAARVEKLAKALGTRPGLKVDVTGRVDDASDRDALARAAVEQALRAAKTQALAARKDAPASTDGAALSAEERPQWLAAAYKALPAEARTRDTPAQEAPSAAEMEAALATHVKPDDATVGKLGLERARVAKEALVARGVAAERVFLAAPRAGEAAPKGAPRRVDFALK